MGLKLFSAPFAMARRKPMPNMCNVSGKVFIRYPHAGNFKDDIPDFPIGNISSGMTIQS
jgi:hypothetical protein